MALDPATILPTIASFSTAGFVISSALPTISAAASQIIKEREGELTVVRIVPLRLLSKFLSSSWLAFFYFVSMLYLLSGLFAVSYQYFSNLLLYDLSIWVLIVSLVLTIGGYGWLVIRSTIYLPSDVKKILEYLPKNDKAHKKAKIPCPMCARNGACTEFRSSKELADHLLNSHAKRHPNKQSA